MAAGGSDSGESSWWGDGSREWFGSMLTSAKEKSSTAFQQISKDIQEFGSTIQKDTTQAVADSATAIGQNLKPEDHTSPSTDEKSTTDQLRDGFYNFLSSVSKNLAVPEKVQGEEYVVQPKDAHVFDQTKARLHAMQVNPGTYCNEPDGPLDVYQEWLESFNVEEMKGEISELLVANSQVRSIYTKLVPAAVSHAEFWSRYFYKVHRLDQDEARRNALKERAEMTSSQTFEEELGWGDEDESWDTVPEAKKTIPTLDPSITETKKQMPEELPPQDVKESLSVKETPNRTELTVESNKNIQETLVKNVEESEASGKTIVPESEEGEEVDGAGVVAEQVAILTLDTENKDQGAAVKEDRSPTESSGSNGNKDSSLGDEWEKDFDDIEITEEDIKNAQLASNKKTIDDNDESDEWENWE